MDVEEIRWATQSLKINETEQDLWSDIETAEVHTGGDPVGQISPIQISFWFYEYRIQSSQLGSFNKANDSWLGWLIMKTFSNYLLNSQYIIILLSKSFLNDEITDEDTAATPKRISVCALLGHQ